MKFKFIPWITFFVISFPLMASCGGDSNDEPAPVVTSVTVNVTPEKLTATPEAAVLELMVKANADWAIRSDADWITIRPSGGVKDTDVKVQVSVTANSDMDERSTVLNIVSGGKTVKTISLVQGFVTKATPSVKTLTMGGQESSSSFTVTANAQWTLTSDSQWLSVNPSSGGKGETIVEVVSKVNDSSDTREGVITLSCGDDKTEIRVTQLSDAVETPDGYTLVWSDEFNQGPVPGSDWTIENWAPGHVNNELQTYTSKEVDGKRTLEVKDGFLYINCFKGKDGKIYSGRMNACPNTGWLYGYVEARILLPKGKGTWPAFWMMPSNVDWNKNPWPYCGEIDIMEEVGANPDYVSSSLHTGNYNHTKGTQKTHEMKCPGAEESFHVYALEWTEDAITTYVDGKVQLRATKAEMGTDHDSWPFHYAFYPILNLAWGGDWGGYKGVDESALPATMKVDYVRIFQKK
ncbi:MAG: family 16 glycosylhydrolase [Muribaculaceae bacterium]|nr:family 16 glycosylhydrolase [Muribaculaceae bacterium]